MKSSRWLDRQTGYLAGALVLLLGIIAPAAFPVFASAASLQSRSITMSSSAPSGSGSGTAVSYTLQATTSANIDTTGEVIIQFCDSASTPIIGTACTHPTGIDVSGVGTATGTDPITGNAYTLGTATNPDSLTNKSIIKWVPTTAVTGGAILDIGFTGITNPSTTGTFYARITTYTDGTANFTDATDVGTPADQGGVALSTASVIGITARVQETMIFCVSNNTGTFANTIGAGCTNTSDPSLNIGQPIVGSTLKALDAQDLSTGDDIAQLSTNASHGAVVNLHSNATSCGGLVRANDGTNCDILPQNVSGNTIAAGQAFFGLKLGPSVDGSGNASGSGTLAAKAPYDATNYFLDFVTGNASGITSTYGSELFDSGGSPVNNMNMPITFAASVSNQTPAGVYSAQLGLIATGTF